MAYKVIILYQLYMPSYFLGTFTEYPYTDPDSNKQHTHSTFLNDKFIQSIIVFYYIPLLL